MHILQFEKTQYIQRSIYILQAPVTGQQEGTVSFCSVYKSPRSPAAAFTEHISNFPTTFTDAFSTKHPFFFQFGSESHPSVTLHVNLEQANHPSHPPATTPLSILTEWFEVDV